MNSNFHELYRISKMIKNAIMVLALMYSSTVLAQAQSGAYFVEPQTIPVDEYLQKIGNADEVGDGIRKSRTFAFWNHCKPLGLGLEIYPHNEGLYNAVRNAVESRLRSARLKNDEEAWGFLTVDVRTVDSLFSINVGFNKNLFDEELDYMGSAETWDTSSFGVYPNESLIVSLISQHIDDFLNTYLRVNEDACLL